jgi:serine/threonine protein kinase
MEYCEGGSLGKLCREMNEPMPYAKVREYARQILQGLAHLHSHGVIHRDIKGDNVLLYHGVVKLADFGTAKRFGGAGIGMNSITGTPTWSAPEMLTNSTLEGCSPQVADVWSVGCTVVEMLTKGEGPWPKFENLFQAVTTIVHHQGMPPNVPTSLPEDLNNFLRCCFEYEPSKRPSAAELLKHAFLRPPLTLSMLKEHIRQSPEVRASDEETVGSSWSDSLGVPIHTSF